MQVPRTPLANARRSRIMSNRLHSLVKENLVGGRHAQVGANPL